MSKKLYRIRSEPKLCIRQKEFLQVGRPSPTTSRFIKEKIAGTGFDPQRALIEFMNHDVIKPLSHSISNRDVYDNFRSNENIMVNKFALRTEKVLTDRETIPKIQQYKYYNFIDRKHLTEEQREQKIKDSINKRVFPFLELKGKYGPHSESTNVWIPYTTKNSQNNRNSVPYNILTNEKNELTGKMEIKIEDKNIFHKKKGVCEFSNFNNPYYPNFNKEFIKLHNENKKIFHTYNGIFSNMYDAASKNGNIYLPFRRNNSPGKN